MFCDIHGYPNSLKVLSLAVTQCKGKSSWKYLVTCSKVILLNVTFNSEDLNLDTPHDIKWNIGPIQLSKYEVEEAMTEFNSVCSK